MGSSSGGGDGGAADRRAAEDARQANAISKLNASFGYGTKKAPIDRADFVTQGPGTYTGYIPPAFSGGGTDYAPLPPAGEQIYTPDEEIFNQAGFDAATNEFNASGGDLPALAQRKAMYQKFASDAKGLQLEDLGKQKDVASRETEFDLARRGLTGGSRQIDINRDIGDQFNKGVLQAETQAQNIANTAEASDEKTRMSLINGIRGGMDQADAVTGALNGMQQSAQAAQNQSQQQDISGFFNEIRGQAQRQQNQQAYNEQFNKYRNGGGAGTGYNGTVQNVG